LRFTILKPFRNFSAANQNHRNMKNILYLLCLLPVFSEVAAQVTPDTSAKQTKNFFQLTINGKNYTIAENEPLKLDGSFLNPTILVKTAAYKLFDNNALSFRYPKEFSFAAEKSPNYKNWSLNGNDVVLLVFELDAVITLDALLDEMIKRFGKQNCSTEDFDGKLGEVASKGKKLFVTLAGEKLLYECYEIKLNDGKSRFIYFQDNYTTGKHTEEFTKAFALVNSTFHAH